MDSDASEEVRSNPSGIQMRKKLEAELRATEEIARLRQNVIEKRLAVELANLDEEEVKVPEEQQQKPAQKTRVTPADNRRFRTSKKPQSQAQEQEDCAEEEAEASSSAFTGVKLQKSPFSLRFRRSPDKASRTTLTTPSFLTFSRKHQLPDVFMPVHSATGSEEVGEEQDEETSGQEDVGTHGKRRGFFLLGVIRKWRKKMRPEEKD